MTLRDSLYEHFFCFFVTAQVFRKWCIFGRFYHDVPVIWTRNSCEWTVLVDVSCEFNCCRWSHTNCFYDQARVRWSINPALLTSFRFHSAIKLFPLPDKSINRRFACTARDCSICCRHCVVRHCFLWRHYSGDVSDTNYWLGMSTRFITVWLDHNYELRR